VTTGLLVALVACAGDAEDPAAPPTDVTTDRGDDLDRDDADGDPTGAGTEEEDAVAAPTLVPTVWPDVVVAGVPSEVLISVAPRGEVSGPVTFVAGPIEGELRDEGGVHAGEFELIADDDVEVTVSATVDGRSASGRAVIAVAAGDLPTEPAPAPQDPRTVTAADGAEVLGDRVVVRSPTG
jgi:hypothetical protein